MESKQTAVEWFYNKLVTGKFTGKDTITFLFETAKTIEKEQMGECAVMVIDSEKEVVRNYIRDQFDKYYNETYGK